MNWTVASIILLVLAWQATAIAEDEFDIKPDLNIDIPPEISIMVPASPNQPSLGPQPNGVVRDLSGWGIAGKLHPNIIIKDKLIKAYHNRMLDPRYTHLRGYGHLGKTAQAKKPNNKVDSFFGSLDM